MALKTNYKRKYELYKEHLATIKGLKFTFREIDVLVCIVHNRGEKKIASMLSISPRTVSVHVYNVMNKLAFNSKDQIIDFIETSGKLLLFREYYLHLLLNSNFEKQLTYIATRINRNETTCYCYRSDALALDNDLYKSIQKHLRLAHIKLVEISPDENSSPIFELSNISAAGYYRNLLKNLLEILNPPQKEQIIGEFDDAFQTIENIHDGKAEEIPDEDNQKAKENTTLFSTKKNLTKRRIIIFVCLIALIISLVSGLMILSKILIANNDNVKNGVVITEAPIAIKNLEEFLEAVKDQKFSADNSHPDQIKKNHSLIKKIEKILEYSQTNETKEYLSKTEMSAEVLTHYLYNLQALASYYMYNMQDGEKAKQILLHAKDLAEKYVNIRGKINNNFSELKNEEVFAELEIIKDLPQIYTRIIYSLGRTYIYKGNAIEGKRYFELAEYLGNKLGLFEGYLSKISGLLVIDNELANSYLTEGKIAQARKILQNIAQSYITLSKDSNSYIADYKPGTTEQKTIIPKENPYNLFECVTRIVISYSKLIQISTDTKQIAHYIAGINNYLQIDKKSGTGLLKMLDQVPEKKRANLYNKLGDLILTLWQLKTLENFEIDYISLKQTINTALLEGQTYDGNINLIHDDLALAEKLFTVAREKSRSTDFTKADSYKGLISTYQFMLNHTHEFLESQRHDLKDQINILEKKLNLIKTETPAEL